jgi:hypothetical protein
MQISLFYRFMVFLRYPLGTNPCPWIRLLKISWGHAPLRRARKSNAIATSHIYLQGWGPTVKRSELGAPPIGLYFLLLFFPIICLCKNPNQVLK